MKRHQPPEGLCINRRNPIVVQSEMSALSQVADDSSRDGGDGIVIQINLQSLSRNVTRHLSETPQDSVEFSCGGVVLISADALNCAFRINTKVKDREHHCK